MKIFSIVKSLAARSGGFTLVEAVIAVGILTLGLGLVGSTVFQSLAIERFWRDDVIAVKDLRHAGSRFAGDALYAETISLGDGAEANAVTLAWTDAGGAPHTAAYSVFYDSDFDDYRLIRVIDGSLVQSVLARGVVVPTLPTVLPEKPIFFLNGRLLTFVLTIEADRGTTKTSSLQTYLRALQ